MSIRSSLKHIGEKKPKNLKKQSRKKSHLIAEKKGGKPPSIEGNTTIWLIYS